MEFENRRMHMNNVRLSDLGFFEAPAEKLRSEGVVGAGS
jgi:hypothetical protein